MSVPLLRPPFGMRFVGTIKETLVRAVVLKDKFQLRGGIVPTVGQEAEMPLSDARDREYMGQVRIIPGTERIIDTGVKLEDPPRPQWPSKW